MVSDKVTCDLCGREKGETNNWPRVRVDANGLRILKPHVKGKKDDKDICGAACLHSLVDRYWSEEARSVVPEFERVCIEA